MVVLSLLVVGGTGTNMCAHVYVFVCVFVCISVHVVLCIFRILPGWQKRRR